MPIQIETIDGWSDGVNLAKPINDLEMNQLRYLQDGLLDEPTILRQRGPINPEAVTYQPGYNPEGMAIYRGALTDLVVTLESNSSDRYFNIWDQTYSNVGTATPGSSVSGETALASLTPGLKGGMWVGYSEDLTGRSPAFLNFWKGGLTSNSSGTVTVARGSTAVTGSGTSFNDGHIGCWLICQTDVTTSDYQYIGVIAKVNSTTSLTLEQPALWALTARNFNPKVLRGFLPKAAVGRITTTTSSAIVTGANTKFKDQGLATGTWDMWKFDHTFIGTVTSVATNTGLTLTGNAAVAMSNERFFAMKRNVVDFGTHLIDVADRPGYITSVYANRQWYANRPTEAGFDPTSTVWFSDPQDPEMVDFSPDDGDFIPVPNTSSTNTPIVGLSAAHNSLVVFKQGETHGIFGQTPSQFTARKLYNDGCLHPGSIQGHEGGVIWAGREGIYFYDGTTVENIVRDRLGDWFVAALDNFTPGGDTMGSAIVNNHYLLYISSFAPTRSIKKVGGDSNISRITIAINLDTLAVSFLTNVDIKCSAQFPLDASSDGTIGILVADVDDWGRFCRLDPLFTDTGLDDFACKNNSIGPKFYLESPKYDMGDPQIKKLFKQVQCLYKAVGDDLRLETIVGLNETSALSTSKFLAQSTYANKRIKFLKRSQYLAFRLYSEDNTTTNLRIGPLAIGFKFQPTWEDVMEFQTIGSWSPAKLAAFIKNLIEREPVSSQTYDELTVGTLTITGGSSSTVLGVVPVGAVLDFAGATAPTGYLLCDGTVYSRAAQAELFAVISTTYNTGGEAGTDFRVPNSMERVTVGLSPGGTAAFDTLGETGGALTTSIAHTHTTPAHNHGISDNAIGPVAGGGAQFAAQSGTMATTGGGNGTSGAMSANDTPSIVQKYITFNKIIRSTAS